MKTMDRRDFLKSIAGSVFMGGIIAGGCLLFAKNIGKSGASSQAPLDCADCVIYTICTQPQAMEFKKARANSEGGKQ